MFAGTSARHANQGFAWQANQTSLHPYPHPFSGTYGNASAMPSWQVVQLDLESPSWWHMLETTRSNCATLFGQYVRVVKTGTR